MTTIILLRIVGALFFGCLFLTIVFTPIVMRFARKIDAIDRGGYRKVFEGAMPLLGGLGVALPLITLCFAAWGMGNVIIHHWKWLYLNHEAVFGVLYSFAARRYDCLTLALGGIAIILLGIVDDSKGMRARYKLLGQIAVALFVCQSGYILNTIYIPLVGNLQLGLTLGVLVTALWIVGLINAFNLIDGVDGLAAGIAFIGAGTLVVLGFIQQNHFVMLTSAALAGSLLAFLLFNFPPARIFLGDTGSMFLGYTLATMTLMGAQKSDAAVILIAPMLALSFPIFETSVSIIRRFLRGVPIFAADNFHTHHRLLHKGYSQPKVVLTLYSVALCLAIAAVLSALIPPQSNWIWCSYAVYGGALVHIAWLAGYLRTTTIKRVYERRQRNKKYHAFGRYAALSLEGGKSSDKTRLVLALCRHELGLRYIEVRLENGKPLMVSTDTPVSDTVPGTPEKLRVKSSDEQDIFIWYEFNQTPDDNYRQDVSSCLAGIFDQMKMPAMTDMKLDENRPAPQSTTCN